jgi:RNA polymerase sigma-70 factor (ECF subfamily)
VYTLNEQDLIHQLKQGNEPAFAFLVNSYKNRLYSAVLNILQDKDDTEDALQETFIQVHESIAMFREDSTLSTWIYRIAVRKALEKLRRRKTRQRIQSIVPWWMPKEKSPDANLHLNEGIEIEQKEQAQALFKAINLLPAKQKIAFTLIQVQGMKYEEACDVMQMGVKAIESLNSRAKENLRKKLVAYYKK